MEDGSVEGGRLASPGSRARSRDGGTGRRPRRRGTALVCGWRWGPALVFRAVSPCFLVPAPPPCALAGPSPPLPASPPRPARAATRVPFPCLGPSRPRLTCLSARPVESPGGAVPFRSPEKGGGAGSLARVEGCLGVLKTQLRYLTCILTTFTYVLWRPISLAESCHHHMRQHSLK